MPNYFCLSGGLPVALLDTNCTSACKFIGGFCMMSAKLSCTSQMLSTGHYLIDWIELYLMNVQIGLGHIDLENWIMGQSWNPTNLAGDIFNFCCLAWALDGPRYEKTCLCGFWPGHTLTSLLSYRYTMWKIEILLVTSLGMILSKNKRITTALISLGGCSGSSVPLLFAISEDRFSHAQLQAQMILYSCTADKDIWDFTLW